MERTPFPSSFLSRWRPKKVTFATQRELTKWCSALIRGHTEGSSTTVHSTILSPLFVHQAKLISLLSFLHFMLKLIMVMSALSEKKINFCCYLKNNRAQEKEVGNHDPANIIFNYLKSLNVVLAAEMKEQLWKVWTYSWSESDFEQDAGEALGRQSAIDCWLIAKRRGG